MKSDCCNEEILVTHDDCEPYYICSKCLYHCGFKITPVEARQLENGDKIWNSNDLADKINEIIDILNQRQ